ncbi:hypothetical protein [Winogradskyella sp.]|uniref:hypothetical protein n=1 Tax=Winogradskyella sp. TaxID=1883156 RepID=UPI003517B82B
MKSTKTLLTLLLFSFALLSCENEELDQENQQEYFEITNLETGEVLSVHNIEAKFVNAIGSETMDFLSIKGSTTISDDMLCVDILLILTPEIIGTYNNESEITMQSTTTCNGGIFGESNYDGGLYLDLQELTITEYGDVGELIHLNFNGGYWHDSQYLMTADLQVFRDE